VGFRFRAYTDGQTLRALKAQLELACEVYNTLRWADTYFHQRDGKGLSKNELRQLALDLRKEVDFFTVNWGVYSISAITKTFLPTSFSPISLGMTAL